jgi:hypothetical protein
MARAKFKFSHSLPWAIAIIGLSAIELSAVAVAQVQSRAIAPTPLNITPRTHIPLPSSNSHYDDRTHDSYDDEIYYRDSDRDYRHSHQRKHKSEGVTVIINTPRDHSFDNSDNYYIRIRRE